jgi:hypothetical protein
LDKPLFACVGLPEFGQIAFPLILLFQLFQKMVDLSQIDSGGFIGLWLRQGNLFLGKIFPDGNSSIRIKVYHCTRNLIFLITIPSPKDLFLI